MVEKMSKYPIFKILPILSDFSKLRKEDEI